jgi:ubiquinone/menaquinone biosynthesis C-methylase UbiE
MDFKEEQWDESYKRGDNFVFYPHEEVIRFVSKYIKKRVGLDKYITIREMNKCLDLGCGIGRHVIYLNDMKFDANGIDLSKDAICFAKNWVKKLGKNELIDKLTVGSITEMPYDDKYFDFVVSHGVLDSMPFDIAKMAIKETHRTMKDSGLFYFDVISGDDNEHYREYNAEEIVSSEHEQGTIQSYYNWQKINELLQNIFVIKEAALIKRDSVISKSTNSRFHVIVEKI